MNIENQIKTVKEIGEQIGYGHLMFLASSLWRKSLIEKGYPESGAFVPTLIAFIKEERRNFPEGEQKAYDELIEKFIKTE